MTRRVITAQAAPSVDIDRLIELKTMPHDDYLRTTEWRTTRNAALRRAGWKCTLCSARTQLQVHHNDYSRLGEELDTDLTVICASCHALFHKGGRPRELVCVENPDPDRLIWRIFREVLPQQPEWTGADIQEAVKQRCAKLAIPNYGPRVASIWDAVLTEIVRPVMERAIQQRRAAAETPPQTLSREAASRLCEQLGVTVRTM